MTMETPKPQTGTWTLTAPDGRMWQAESPLRCCGMEQRERVPASVAMARIMAGRATTERKQMNKVEQEQRQARFRSDLGELLNKHSRENESNTPDFVLADYLIECLRALDDAISKRSSWYSRWDKPGA